MDQVWIMRAESDGLRLIVTPAGGRRTDFAPTFCRNARQTSPWISSGNGRAFGTEALAPLSLEGTLLACYTSE
jgi:hypothetical protein